MTQFFDIPAGGRRIAAVCVAVVMLAAVGAEGADTGSVPAAVAWILSGALLLAALAVRRDRFVEVAAAGIAASCLVTGFGIWVGARAEATFGLVESAALLLVVVRATRRCRPVRAAALTGAALVALSVIPLRLPTSEWPPLVPFVVPFFWLTTALAVALGLYLRLLDRYRAQQHAVGLQAQRLEYARELHDFVGHHVTAIIAQTKAVRYATAAGMPPSAEELDGMLAAVEEAGAQAMQSMRSMVTVLRTPLDDGPDRAAGAPGTSPAELRTQLRTLTDQFAATGPATTLTLDPRLATGALPPGVATTVHHIVRESLTNIRKHARGAKTVTVDVRLDGDTAHPVVLASVTDDGPDTCPADATSPSPGTGYGLTGLAERAALVGGTFQAGTVAGVGWAVEARIPLPGPFPPLNDPADTATLNA
ncbi:signal transduction histidine kinase [Streptomyces sp. TLI_55]|uniref:sensor histidine kinase n=1 Tax=Streptomyces sp. TLI_55 TaxID=1938861 RepID=UPI000BD20262|nr:histidine kinase [Streptomyces sp. TLI_55]SNX88433.1 signal transduction histidine kinase [Streptomyces sp. TLI_55]